MSKQLKLNIAFGIMTAFSIVAAFLIVFLGGIKLKAADEVPQGYLSVDTVTLPGNLCDQTGTESCTKTKKECDRYCLCGDPDTGDCVSINCVESPL